MNRIGSLLAGVLLFSLIGCTGDRLLERLVPADADDFARSLIADWHAGDVAAVISVGSSEFKGLDGVEDTLEELSHYFPPGVIEEVELIGADVHSTQNRTVRNVTYEVRTTESSALVALRFSEVGTGRFLDGMQIEPQDESLHALHALQMGGKSATHYFMAMAALFVFLFCVVVAIKIARTPMPRRWLWVLVALLGVGGITLNWTTGEVEFRLLALQFLGFGFRRLGMVGPWFLTVSVPVGALIALSRRRRALALLEGLDESLSNDSDGMAAHPGPVNTA